MLLYVGDFVGKIVTLGDILIETEDRVIKFFKRVSRAERIDLLFWLVGGKGMEYRGDIFSVMKSVMEILEILGQRRSRKSSIFNFGIGEWEK